VIGVGGIGGVLAATWLKEGIGGITLVTPNDGVRRAFIERKVSLNGTRLDSQATPEKIVARLEESDGLFDVAFLAVQPDQIESSLEALTPHLGDGAEVVTLTNGLCDEKVSSEVGVERAIGAIVMWGARMRSPGQYLRTSRGGFVVGKLSGAKTPISAHTIELLNLIGRTRLTDNLLGARFSKLALNSAISTIGTIGGKTLGHLLLQRHCRALTLGIVREAVAVAHAEGIHLESVTPLDLEWLGASAERAEKGEFMRHLSLLFVGFRYRKLRSSMLAAVERGRQPAVDYLNGEIVRRGEALRVATPLNKAASQLVWEIAAGRTKPGPSALHALARQTETAI
jgi:2-dehydropantoate 2-reductase